MLHPRYRECPAIVPAVRSVSRTPGSTREPLAFAYGASGQRTQKQVGDPDGTTPTGYREHYIRDAQGNIMATYRFTNNGPASLELQDRPMYGSSRLGTYGEPKELRSLMTWDPADPALMAPVQLNYELTDHLGNVAAVVTGRLLTGNGSGAPKQAELVSAQGYEPFGSLLPGRNYSSDSYRFGFNTQEKDDEMYGATGTSLDFGARTYDPRVGRWMSIDPMASSYPAISPYVFVGNSPVTFVDTDGEKITIYYEDKNGKKSKIVLRSEADIKKLTSVDNAFVQDFHAAIEYLRTNNADQGIVKSLIESKKNFKVKQTTAGDPTAISSAGSHYNRNTKTIHWSNIHGGAFKTMGELQYSSPAMILLSEMGKAYKLGIEGFKLQHFYGVTSDQGLSINGKQVGGTVSAINAQKIELENQVARYIELPAAMTLNKAGFNEGIRGEWTGGAFFKAKDVTSTEPESEEEGQRVRSRLDSSIEF